MSLVGVSPELFLREKSDNAQTTNNFQDGITILNRDGSRYLNLAPTNNPLADKATFFRNDVIDKVFLRDGRTGEMKPYESPEGFSARLSQHIRSARRDPVATQKIANLSALEIAIEDRNMDRVQEIISKDSLVINRQMPVGKDFPLLMAIRNDNAEAAAFIMSKNPNLLLNTEDGKNVLTELSKLSDVKLKEQIKTLFVAQKEAFDKGYKR